MYKISTKCKLPFLPRFVKQVVNTAGLFPAMKSLFIVGVSCHGDVIYLSHVLVINPRRACRDEGYSSCVCVCPFSLFCLLALLGINLGKSAIFFTCNVSVYLFVTRT